VENFVTSSERIIYNRQCADFRAYFPRFLAIFRAYFPRAGLPKKPFALISPGLLGLNDIRRDFRVYFPRPSRTFAPISPGLLRRLPTFRAYFPRSSWSLNPNKGDFRAYFPRPIAPFTDLLRLFPSRPAGLQIPVKDDFRACFPRPYCAPDRSPCFLR
jgi:hypothetical protein